MDLKRTRDFLFDLLFILILLSAAVMVSSWILFIWIGATKLTLLVFKAAITLLCVLLLDVVILFNNKVEVFIRKDMEGRYECPLPPDVKPRSWAEAMFS